MSRAILLIGIVLILAGAAVAEVTGLVDHDAEDAAKRKEDFFQDERALRNLAVGLFVLVGVFVLLRHQGTI